VYVEHTDFVEHGYCLLWEPGLVWLHVISDIITGLAYYSIPVALFYFIYKRRDTPFQRVFILFGAFIFSCGTTHFFSAYTIFVPAYWPEGIVKAITAAVSAVAVLMFIPLIPKAIALPSLTKALEEIKLLNKILENQVEELTIKDSAMVSSPNAIGFSDLGGHATYVNKAFLKLWGYDSDEKILGKSVREFWQSAEEVATVADALRSRGNWTGEQEAKRRDGSIFMAEVISSMVLDRSGKPIGFMGIFIDITDRKLAEESLKRSEEALRQSEERFRRLYERAPIPYQSLDESGFIIEVNDTWLDKMGYSRDEVIGEHFSDFMTSESRELQKKKLPCFMDTGEIRDTEFEMVKKDGSHIIASFDGKIGYDDKGNFQQTHCVFHDITERRKSEEEKRRLEEQLRQAQKMEAVGQLAGGIAHDFNNVLSAIMGYGYLLKRKISQDSPMRDDIEQILESADRAAEVTRNLLAFSRKQIMNIQPVDINDIIRKVGKMLSRIIGEDIEIITKCATDQMICVADAGQIEQVLINLATNARDAMPKGGTLTINAETAYLDEAFIGSHGYGKTGTYVLLTVSDTGIGISQEEIDKIFEPFFTTKEVGKGTGLGLAMVYGIIKQHDGYITVDSDPEKGTTFRIYLPQAALTKEAAVQQPKETTLLMGSETILVAEDDDKLRKLSEVVLTGNGYKVILAGDGEEAIRKFVDNKDQIQLAIVDMIMPKKGGKEVFDEIIRIKPDVKVLFSSGYTADRIDNIDLLRDNLNFITKPVLPGALLQKVRDILDS
jgi:two-component system, cell cycle sensor histidine kinase and response regulator CckA